MQLDGLIHVQNTDIALIVQLYTRMTAVFSTLLYHYRLLLFAPANLTRNRSYDAISDGDTDGATCVHWAS